MPNRYLVDSSFLFAYLDKSSDRHEAVRNLPVDPSDIPIIPEVILVEVAFLFDRIGGAPAKAGFLRTLLAAKPLIMANVLHQDLYRVIEILEQYPEANFDFVDCCVMVISERLEIRRIATLDRRDFSIFRPRHCDFLELIP